MGKKILAMLMTFAMIICLMPALTLTASAANPAFILTKDFTVQGAGTDYSVRKAIGLPGDKTAVLLYASNTYYLSIFNNAGIVLVNKLNLNDLMTTKYSSEDCNILALSSGNVVVTYNKSTSDGSPSGESFFEAYFMVIDQTGSRVVNQTQINSVNPSNVLTRFVSMTELSNGNIAFSWQRNDNGSVATRVFTTSGTPVTSETLVNSGTNAGTSFVSSNTEGTYMVAYYYSDYNSTTTITTYYCKYIVYNNNGSEKAQGTVYSGTTPAVSNCYTSNLMTLSNGYYAYMVNVNGTITVYLLDSSGTAKGNFTISSGSAGWLAQSKTTGSEGFIIPSYDAASAAAISANYYYPDYDNPGEWTGTEYVYLNYYNNSGVLQYTTPVSVDSGFVSFSGYIADDWMYNTEIFPSFYLYSGYSRGIGLIKTDHASSSPYTASTSAKLFDMGVANAAPTFVGGTTTLTVNQNAAATDIKSLLHVSDSDSSQTLTWLQSVAPTHGTLTISSATASSGSTDITPGGTITYTPSTDYSGTDSFTIQVSDETATATRMISVTVNSTSPAITSATYDASTGVLAVTGNNMTTGDTIAVNKLTLTGEGGGTYTLTTADVSATNSTSFSVMLNATDKAAVNQILNKNGTSSTGGTTYNLAAADDWDNSVTTGNTLDVNNVVTVSKVAPTVTISSTTSSTTNISPIPVTITFSESVTGLTNSDVIINNGTIGSLTDSGNTYNLSIIPSGQGEFTVDVPAGSAVDGAGNPNTAATQFIRTYDSVAPNAPTELDVDSGSDTGASNTDNITRNTTPTITGKAELGSTVYFYKGGISLGTAIVDGSGVWSFITGTLSEGMHTFTATAMDAAGNTSVASPALAVTIDTTAVTAPSTLALAAASDTGASNSDNLTNDTTPTFTGMAVANSTVTVYSSIAGALGTTTADIAGNWSFTSPDLAAGPHTITATSSDAAGNSSGVSSGLTINIHTMQPTATVAISKTAMYSGDTAVVTITFSEAVTNFDNTDLTVPNGTLTAVGSTDGGTTFTATFTAANVNDTTNTITLALPGVADTAGNTGSGTASSANYTIAIPTAPDAPTIGTATAGNGQATVSFTAPASNGATITGYTATSNPGGITGTSSGSPITVTGLTNGTAYTFTVTATNSAGTGTASAASNSVTPKATQTITFANPGVQNFGTTPTLTATSSSALTVTFTSDTPDVCTITAGGALTFLKAGPATITAHQEGNAAWQAAMDVSRSFAVNAVAPGAPTVGTATAGNGQATVSFTAPASDGGFAITGYTVTANPGGFTGTGTASPITVTGLTNGTAYTFTVTATNGLGTGSASAASNNVTPATVPGAPIIGTATAGDGQATISFTAPVSTGGAAITGYTVTANPGGKTGTGSGSPITVAGLTNGTSYTFTVTATNSAGTGTSSGVSNGVTPCANSTISTTTAAFDKYESSVNYKDIAVTVSLKGNTLNSIKNGTTALVKDTDYTVSGSTYAIKKEYLKKLNSGIANLTFDFNVGDDPVLTVTVSDTTPSATGSSPTQTTSTVVVDGQARDAGTSATSTNASGQSVTTVTVDDTKLSKILETSSEKPTVTLPSTGSDVTVGELSGQTIKSMEQKEVVLEIKTETVTYTLPAAQINIDDVSAQLGSQVALKDIKVSVSIAEPSADTVKIVEDTANRNSYQLVVKPVEFEITCTSGGKTVEVSKFNGYVERTVAIPDGVDPSKITTGIVLNSDGTFSHVPTTMVKIDGKYYAKISSLTNSTYSVIYNPVTFTDLSSHWSKNAVNDMGSRMVVTGMGNGTYEPDRSITRAEFAAIVVRAMGLKKGTTESAFGDVSASDWFNGYVDTATDYSLITGYDTTTYGPNDTITREQAMAILARAMKLTGLSVSLTDSEMTALLANYTDGASVSAYARTSAATCLKAGIITGSGATALSPKSYVTRAEVAVMVQRLLQKSGLI